MSKRIFIGIKPSSALQDNIADWQAEHHFPFRWVRGPNLHLTLVPPWNETEDALDATIQRFLSSLAGLRQFALSLDHIGYGPNSQHPRLVWLVGEASKPLRELRDRVLVEFADQLPPNHRSFIPHITLARLDPQRTSISNLPPVKTKVEWSDLVREVVLYESRLKSGGARYTPLATANLEEN